MAACYNGVRSDSNIPAGQRLKVALLHLRDTRFIHRMARIQLRLVQQTKELFDNFRSYVVTPCSGTHHRPVFRSFDPLHIPARSPRRAYYYSLLGDNQKANKIVQKP